MESKNNILLFDGICNFCNSSINLLMDIDKNAVIKYASLQSDFGQNILRNNQLSTSEFHSLIFLHNGQLYKKSEALLKISEQLGGFYIGLKVFKLVPRFLRDGVYDLIAKNRYRLFGKKEACRLPTASERSRFVQ